MNAFNWFFFDVTFAETKHRIEMSVVNAYGNHFFVIGRGTTGFLFPEFVFPPQFSQPFRRLVFFSFRFFKRNVSSSGDAPFIGGRRKWRRGIRLIDGPR